MEKSEIFVPERAINERKIEKLSPIKGYKLIITPFSVGKGYGEYSQGLVYSPDGKLIAEIQRNYRAFPFTFIENHPNGKDYLIAGEDYQGQTVIELNTGKRLDCLSKNTDKGWGFCWTDYRFDVASQILVVDGCIWACPYEYRFYNFSDPMNGWPEIVRIHPDGAEGMIDQDDKWPTFEADGVIKCYQTESPEDDDDDHKNDRPIAAILTLKREENKLTLIDEWVSDKEKAIRIERMEAEKKREKWKANFRASDPLYLAYKESLKDPFWKPEEHEWGGITSKDWCPDFEKEEQRWCRRILDDKEECPYIVDLNWAVDTGPVKITIFKDGNSFETKFFKHSVEGMNEAFAYAKKLVSKSECIVSNVGHQSNTEST